MVTKEVLKFMEFARRITFIDLTKLLAHLGNVDFSSDRVEDIKAEFQKEFNRELTSDDVYYFILVNLDDSSREEAA